MPVYHFDEAAHVYTVDGVPVPSVTQLLAPIKQDFSMVRADVLEAKRELGSAVHLACEYDDNDELDGDQCDALVMGYVEAWRRFRREKRADVLENERKIFHPTLGYAGTLDRLMQFDGEAWLIDLKTSAGPVPSYGVQLAGYTELLRVDCGAGFTPKRATVHLRGDGTYLLKQFSDTNDFACFRALLSINQWKANQK